MDPIDRLTLLSQQMDYEPAEDAGCPKLTPVGAKRVPEVSHAVMENGRRVRLLKTLLTSACERNCYYCPFRAGRDFRRATLRADELANTFMSLHRAGVAEGIFLSSGVIKGGIHTQDQMIAAGEILRNKYHYRGYLHLKLMPGAERDQVLRAMQLADRVSINLEGANEKRLERLAPRKDFIQELLQPLRWADEIRRSLPGRLAWNGRWPSTTTQFVVGAAGESDLELLTTTQFLTRRLNLRRAYFSAFRPVDDTPLDGLPAESPVREMRLYQASFLLRDYGFDLEDMPFDTGGLLPHATDPKTAWAQAHLTESPIEINRAGRGELLRIPGIGVKGASAILASRAKGTLRSPEDLRAIGVNPQRALPFILLAGVRPAQQLRFNI